MTKDLNNTFDVAAREPSGPTPLDLHLGKRLRRRRRLLGMTQQQLAEEVGVRFQQIQKYECGGNRISATRLYDIGKALQVPIGYFYDGFEQENSPSAESDEVSFPTAREIRQLKAVGPYMEPSSQELIRHAIRIAADKAPDQKPAHPAFE